MVKINWSYHIHTSYTHGQNSVDEIASYCKSLGIREIAITEHIRAKPSYNFEKLRFDILNAKRKYKINIYTGVEAKILPNGLLDAPEKILSKADLVIGSVHSWPEKVSIMDAYLLLVKSPATIIGHPRIVNEEIIRLLIEFKKILEISYKYPLSDELFLLIRRFPKLRLSLGADAHKLIDINDSQDYFKQIIKKYRLVNQLWKIGDKL